MDTPTEAKAFCSLLLKLAQNTSPPQDTGVTGNSLWELPGMAALKSTLSPADQAFAQSMWQVQQQQRAAHSVLRAAIVVAVPSQQYGLPMSLILYTDLRKLSFPSSLLLLLVDALRHFLYGVNLTVT